jgi:hypothetical protein
VILTDLEQVEKALSWELGVKSDHFFEGMGFPCLEGKLQIAFIKSALILAHRLFHYRPL